MWPASYCPKNKQTLKGKLKTKKQNNRNNKTNSTKLKAEGWKGIVPKLFRIAKIVLDLRRYTVVINASIDRKGYNNSKVIKRVPFPRLSNKNVVDIVNINFTG